MDLATFYTQDRSVDLLTFVMNATIAFDSEDKPEVLSWNEEVLGPKPGGGDLAAVLAMPAPALTKGDLAAYAASVRYAKETGGFTFQGHPIVTDEVSQAKIGNAALGASIEGSAFSTQWKGSDGVFFPLDQPGMMAMALAIFAFVNACYAAERTVQAGITAGSITTAAQIDGFDWPSNAVAASTP